MYEDTNQNLLFSIFNINSSGLKENDKFRIQLSVERRELLKEISLKENKQLIILARYSIDDKSIYIYAPTSHYLLRDFEVRSSIWFSDKAAMIDAYKNDSIETGKEDGGSVDTICFSGNVFFEAIDYIISTLPILTRFTEREFNKVTEYEETLNFFKEENKFKQLIGYVGEYIFHKNKNEILIDEKHIKSSLWNYVVGEKYENHDFKIELEDLSTRFIEIKSSSPLSESHYISKNEINFMEKNKEAYTLITFKLGSEFMSYLYSANKISLKDLDELIEQGYFSMEIYNGYSEISNAFLFEEKTFSIRKK